MDDFWTIINLCNPYRMLRNMYEQKINIFNEKSTLFFSHISDDCELSKTKYLLCSFVPVHYSVLLFLPLFVYNLLSILIWYAHLCIDRLRRSTSVIFTFDLDWPVAIRQQTTIEMKHNRYAVKLWLCTQTRPHKTKLMFQFHSKLGVIVQMQFHNAIGFAIQNIN